MEIEMESAAADCVKNKLWIQAYNHKNLLPCEYVCY